MDFYKTTEKLWQVYFSGDAEEKRAAFCMLHPECMIVGTGASEIYHSRETFAEPFWGEQKEREGMEFQLRNFWCRERPLGQDACLVYGGIHIWWESADRRIYVDMDSRFSVVYQRVLDEWKIVHLHHSVPNQEQRPGEYYPRTLVKKLREAQNEAEHLKELAERDGLTGLMNYRALKNEWRDWYEPGSWLFLIDIDDFKKVNDTYGHMAGNELLQRVAEVLVDTVRGRDLVCRMGGDEFVLLCGGVGGQAEAEQLAKRVLARLRQAGCGESCWTGVSIGGTAVQTGETLESVLRRADKALYRQKRDGKDGFKVG